MKKIIYSLVIMIAAGSLFTSCIEPVEPNGLETLRIEKANYLKALAALQQSKTQLVAAQAAAEQALAAQRTAEATYQTALANYQDALTAALRAQTEMDQQRFAIEMKNLTALYEHEALMRALEYDAAVAALDAMKEKYAAEAAEAAVKLAMLQADVDYKELLNEAQRIQNLKDQQDMELAKKAFEQEYGQQAAMFALQLARYEAETAQKAAEAAALVAAQELLNKNQELQNSQLAQEIEQAQKAFEQQYGYQEALNALELARIEAANNAAAKEAEAMLEDLIDQIGYNAAMRALEIARQAVQDENDAAAMEIALKELEQAYNKQVALDAIEIAKAQVDLAKANLDLEGFAAGIENLKKQFEYAEIYRAYELQKAIDNYGIDALKAANEIENLKMQQQLNKVLFAQAIANAKQSLKETLDAIDLKNVGLTDEEWARVNKAIKKYEQAYDAYLDQQVVVMAAEADLFNAQYAATHPAEDYYVYILSNDEDFGQHAGLYTLNFAPTVENYEAAIDILEGFIDADKQAIAELEEKGALPNDADLRAWAEQLQGWKDQMGKNQYYQYAQTQDSINYMVNVFHDGIAEVAKEVLDWCMEHPYIAAPAPVAEVVDIEPALEKIDNMTIADMPADTLEFDTLPLAHGNAFAIDRFSDYSYNKLRHMLSTYPSEYWWNFFYRDDDELVLDNVTRNAKDFILGDPEYVTTDKVLEFTDADGYVWEGRYGLEGVYTTLAREKVMLEKDETFKENAEKNYNYAKKRYEDDRALLTAGLDAYVSAKMDAYEKAQKDLNDLKAEEAAKGNTMVQAVLNFQEQLNIVAGHTQMTLNDSTKIFEAIQNFAAAREEYLGPNVKAKDGKTAAQIRAAVENFHYAAASSPVTAADINWADMTWNDLRTNQDRGTYGNASIYAFNASNGMQYVGQSGETYATNAVFAVLVDQLINKDIANKFDNEPVIQWANPIGTGLQGINAQNFQALYGQFKMVEDGVDADGNKKYKFQTLDGEDVKSPEIIAAEEAVTKAEKAVKDAFKAYIDIYNRFWAVNVNNDVTTYSKWAAYKSKVTADPQKPADIKTARKALIDEVMAAMPLDVTCYTTNTFIDPVTAVIFNGVDMQAIDRIIKGEDLNVILTAVDPSVTNREGVVEWSSSPIPYTSAQILYGTYYSNLNKGAGRYEWVGWPSSYSTRATEFTQYLFAWQQYIASQVDMAKDLELLRAWITNIEETIAADEAAAEEELEAFKEELKEEITTKHDEAVAKHDAAVEAYNAQMEARNQTLADWAEFFGVYDNPLTGKQDTLAYYWITNQDCAHWPVETWRNSFSCVNYQNQYIDEEAGVWNGPQPGMMNNRIAGTFQEILDANLPGYPEKVAEWNHFARQYADVQYHLQTLYDTMNAAYMAAAKVVDPTTTETDLIKYVEDYKIAIEKAIADLYDEINEHTAEIEWLRYAIAQIEAGVDPFTAWQKVCEMNLEYQNQVLDDLKTKLDLRKADYDAVMEYINAKSEE